MSDLYLEDFAVGDTFVTAGATVTEAAIIDFARTWDPQPFHLDVEAAGSHEMNGLLASGLHTLCLTFRLFLQLNILEKCNITGPGIDDLRWLKPVRPGDTLHAEVSVVDVRQSGSKPDRGSLTMHYRTLNQRGDCVLEFDLRHIVRRRPG